MEITLTKKWLKPNEIPKKFKSVNHCLVFLGMPESDVYSRKNKKMRGTLRQRYDSWELKQLVDYYYRRFSKEYHPDRENGDAELFKLGTMAKTYCYERLGFKKWKRIKCKKPKPETRICVDCSKPFKPELAWIRCPDCRVRVCDNCGKEYTPASGNYDRSKRHYCSTLCAAQGRRKKIKPTCDGCLYEKILHLNGDNCLRCVRYPFRKDNFKEIPTERKRINS